MKQQDDKIIDSAKANHKIQHQSQTKNIPYKNGKGSSERGMSQTNKGKSNEEGDMKRLKDVQKKKWIIIGGIIIFVIIGLAIFIPVYYLILKKKNHEQSEEDTTKSITTTNQKDPIIISVDAMKVFEPAFQINSKVKTLTQLQLKSTQEFNTMTDGLQSSYSTFTKAKYDIYTLNETSSGEDKDFYSTKYTSVITINSFCTKFASDSTENDCDLKKYLDLNIKNTNNLRRNDEVNTEQIKKVILPICIIEHTNTNIIISVTCPETLSSNLKKDIILAFQSIKPDSANSINEDENSSGNKIETKDNKVYIQTFSNVCVDYDGDPSINMNCKTTNDIVTDKEGNLISSKKVSTSETIKDENNTFSNNLIYIFEDISKQNTESFNQKNYEYNLNIVLDLTKSLMKKEIYMTSGSFKEVLDFLSHDDDDEKPETYIRNLEGESREYPGVNEQSVFKKSIYGINMTLNLKNDIGLGELEKAKVITNFNTGNKSQELSHDEVNTKLNETLNEFIKISKAGNKMASVLYEEINSPFLDLRDIIIKNIEELNNLLAFKDLSSIFDSTLAVNDLEKLRYIFVFAAENLYNNLSKIYDDVPYIITDMKKQFKSDISKFLGDSHELLNNIFQNLLEVTNALSSKKSKIAEIASYYFNNTDTSYVKDIQQAKEILDTYYIEEIKLKEKSIDTILNSFPERTLIEPLKNIRSSLENINEKLDNGDLLINLASVEDYKNTIKNIYNANNKVDEIIEYVKQKFEEDIGIQSNGYFETQKELDSNRKSYGEISERAMNISYTLDSNALIDKTFDTLMIDLREQFIILLKYMDKSKNEKFALKEDVLSTSIFPNSYINEINSFFRAEREKIKNFIEDENNEYLDLINEKIKSVKNENGNNIEQTITNIQNQLSDLTLDNINTKYKETLSNTFTSINNLIEYNKNLAVQYLTDVNNKQSTHITQYYINKYNIYINSLYQVRSYILNNLKNDLANKYKNIINQIRTNLQSIKSNAIIKKFKNQFEFTENHLRIIDALFIRLDKHISDNLFNQKYLPLINTFISNTKINLNQIEEDLKNFYNIQSRLAYSSSNDCDYYKYERYSYRCCKIKFGRCWKHKTCHAYHYVGYNVDSGSNHQQLLLINMDLYTQNFDVFYNNIYSKFSNYISSYNNILLQLSNPLESIKQNIINKNKNNNYLNDLTQKINSIINEKLGTNLINACYNYYKNEITNNLPTELNNILDKWKQVYDKLYDDLNLNINNFKSSINDFPIFGSFYYNVYHSNMSYDYSDSVTNKLKSDFNYTIKYYYNIISSEINKTYSYILNNLPKNEKPFDEILIMRTNEIRQSYNNRINQIIESKNEMLKIQNQKNTLRVNEANFFMSNSYTTDNVDEINRQLSTRITKLMSLANQNVKETSEELTIARFYLENSQNGKQMQDIFESVDKATFIDLRDDIYQELIDKIIELDQDELIKNLNNSLINSNEELTKKFKYEKEKIIAILENKIYKEYYTKEELEKQIETIYTNGLKNLDTNNKNIVYGYLNEVLNGIKSHITNEISRLSNELTSYSTNHDLIKNRLNNYKTSIYNQFYSSILFKVNDFYSHVKEKFYSDYIVKYLDEYLDKALNENSFGEAKFLNISFNLKEIVNENIISLINEYENLALTQINYFNQKNIQQLDNLFSFNNINKTINNEINSIESKLLNILKEKAIYNPGDEGVSDYDLSSSIIGGIEQLINQKIDRTKEEIEKMKGNNYLEENFNSPPDFSLVKKEEFNQITTIFNTFINTYKQKESDKFNEVVLENLKNNFKLIIDNFVPSFGKDFFDRILKYNEIQKIQSLYNNLKYSITETFVYYISICSTKSQVSSFKLTEDIKLKILTLNNIDDMIKTKNADVISNLNSKVEQFLEQTKNYIVDTYIREMKQDTSIQLNFDDSIRKIIQQSLDGRRTIFENEYIKMMNAFIKEPFINQYKNILNKEINEINYFISKLKDDSKNEFNKIFTLNPDEILTDIENKLNNTKKAVNAYITHFNESFKISENVKNYLDNYGRDIIYVKYKDIKEILDNLTKDIIINNLIKNSNDFEKAYLIDIFENKINKINETITGYFKGMNESLKRYGYIEEEYKLNLKKEISNYERIRRLDQLDEEKIIYNQQAGDLQLVNTFQKLQNSSLFMREFIETLTLFSDFDDKINKYINDIEYQKSISENAIKNNKENYNELKSKLDELSSLSSSYYDKANIAYYQLKESIINYINKTNELIEECENASFKSITENYNELKDQFIPVSKASQKLEESLDLGVSKETAQEKDYFIETTISNYLKDNEVTLDIIYEEGKIKRPKVVGKVNNKNKPQNIEINFYSKFGQLCGKIGRTITAQFNNISLYSDINFDSGLGNAKINTSFYSDEYDIHIKFYEDKEYTESYFIGGIPFEMPTSCIKEFINTPEGEKDSETVDKKVDNIIESYDY